ncbi:hypothetical protein C8Q77DRAFT_198201 [Trametes polyzona]|nr:hypothetical protein C8Q77DRAFT_198201 [Trametes polyzona]
MQLMLLRSLCDEVPSDLSCAHHAHVEMLLFNNWPSVWSGRVQPSTSHVVVLRWNAMNKLSSATSSCTENTDVSVPPSSVLGSRSYADTIEIDVYLPAVATLRSRLDPSRRLAMYWSRLLVEELASFNRHLSDPRAYVWALLSAHRYGRLPGHISLGATFASPTGATLHRQQEEHPNVTRQVPIPLGHVRGVLHGRHGAEEAPPNIAPDPVFADSTRSQGGHHNFAIWSSVGSRSS